MTEDDSTRQQRLVDALQAAALYAERLEATATQESEVARLCKQAIAKAIAEVRPTTSEKGGVE